MFSRFGQAQVAGRNVIVHVTVGVPPGVDGNRAAAEALRAQGARPFVSQESALTGLVWPETGTNSNNDPVFELLQNYNGSADPTDGEGVTALTNARTTWNDVTPSTFAFLDGGSGAACPSLVRECSGPQVLDGANDVSWVRLNGPFTLAVTWFSAADREADMAMNTNFPWNTNGSDDFDVETVMLHEEGHVLGLAHSSETAAVMYATYSGVHRWLHQDDEDGINALYTPPTPCVPTHSVETVGVTCGDGIDNDCDGFTDSDDLDCQYCGDGIAQTTEECDGVDLADETCVSQGFSGGGILTCNSGCSTFNTDACDPGDPGQCTVVGDTCTSDGDCCSNKCRGRRGNKTCK